MAQATAPLFDSTIRCVAFDFSARSMSVVSPIATKMVRRGERSEVPQADVQYHDGYWGRSTPLSICGLSCRTMFNNERWTLIRPL